LTAQDIADLMEKLYQEGKYGQALFIADTCQAFTLFDKITTPNVLALGTSLKGENAYAHHCKLSHYVSSFASWQSESKFLLSISTSLAYQLTKTWVWQ
jgi:glycosylphosphatidylinositol transamidase (GPIT) subunit GPI8